MGIVRLLIRAVTFWNNILAESGKSPVEQLFGVAKRITNIRLTNNNTVKNRGTYLNDKIFYSISYWNEQYKSARKGEFK